jgi:hypothetical protein
VFAAVLAAWSGTAFTAVTGYIVTISLASDYVVAGLSCAPRCLWPAYLVSGFGGDVAADLGSRNTVPLTLIDSQKVAAAAYPLGRSFVFTLDFAEIRQFVYFLAGAGCPAPVPAPGNPCQTIATS